MSPFLSPADYLRRVGKLGPYAEREPAPADVRAWAAQNSVPLKAKGPIPAAVIEQYRNALKG